MEEDSTEEGLSINDFKKKEASGRKWLSINYDEGFNELTKKHEERNLEVVDRDVVEFPKVQQRWT